MSVSKRATLAQMMRDRKSRKRYITVIVCLAILVAGVTTAALRIDISAMTRTTKVLTCALEVHAHNDDCYDEEGNLVCQQADYVVHVHNDDCYDDKGNLDCPLPEIRPHTHDDSCYETQQLLVCGLEETDGPHTHSDACYASEVRLTCGQVEPPEGGHAHGDACYTYTEFLTCGQEEYAGHTHTDACYADEYDEEGNYIQTNLICGQEEYAGHSHSGNCYGGEYILTCGRQEAHGHTDSCYETVTYLACGLEETAGEAHHHNSSCYEKWDELACGQLEQHVHDDELCYSYDEDGNAHLTCTETELLAHFHGSECFTMVRAGDEEEVEDVEPTERPEFCYNEIGELICGLEEHTHSEECLDENGELICTLEEHTHKVQIVEAEEPASCYDEDGELICGLEEHTHTEECLDENGELICTLEEHTHIAPAVEEEETVLLTKTYQDDSVVITATYDESANIPEEAELRAYQVTQETAPERYEQRLEDARAAAEAETAEGVSVTEIVIYNIGFYLGDEEIEPEAPVTITILPVDAENFAQSGSVAVVHFDDEQGAQILEGVVDEDGATSFETNSFSDFSIPVLKDGDYAVAAISGSDSDAAAISDANLLLWLTFDGQNWNDKTGNAKLDKQGSPNTEWISHNGGLAAGLNTTSGSQNAYVIVTKQGGGSLLSGVSEMTVDYWAKLNSTDFENWTFYAAPNGNKQTYKSENYIGIRHQGSYVVERWKNGRESSYSSTIGSGSLDKNWHHVVVVFESNRTTLYVDGEKKQSVASSASLSSILGYNSTLLIGRANWNDGEFYHGYLDDFKIYNYAMSESEVTGKAATTYKAQTVGRWNLQQGKNYLVYYSNGNDIEFLSAGSGNGATSPVKLNQALNLGNKSRSWWGTWEFTASDLTASDSTWNILWQVEFTNGGIALKSTTGKYLRLLSTHSNLNTVVTDNETFDLTQIGNGPGMTVRTTRPVLDYKNGYSNDYVQLGYYSSGWTGDRQYWYVDTNTNHTIYFAEVNADTSYAQGSNYPASAETKPKPSTAMDKFYNVTVGEDNTLDGLADVEYTIYDSNGNVVTKFTTNSNMETTFPGAADLPGGEYTMKQTSVPPGYVKNPETWTVTVSGAGVNRSVSIKDSTGTGVGVIYNYKDRLYDANKTGEVVDYENRTYRVDITGWSEAFTYTAEPINVTLVVDQSNSMLFPADLQEINGLKITLTKYNAAANIKELNDKLTDKSRVYYFIKDPTTSSTVFAVWWDGTSWMFQDAAYYYKAMHGVREGNNQVSYPHAGFGGVGTNFNGAIAYGGADFAENDGTYLIAKTLTSETFQIYEPIMDGGAYYTRLSYLEEAMALLIREVGALNPNSSISLVQFASTPSVDECITRTLNPQGMQELLAAVGDITTIGGTRQDLALEHVIADEGGEHDHLSEKNPNYVVLITDGAPAVSSGVSDTLPEIMDAVEKDAGTLKNIDRAGKKVTLATIGLSVDNVDGGSALLKKIATGGWGWSAQRTSQVKDLLLNEFFNQLVEEVPISISGEVEDVISDSFYPIAKSDNPPYTPLKNGDWITYGGQLTSEGADDAAGQVIYNESTREWSVKWLKQRIKPEEEGGWHGTIYLKAREDFIGGNAIDTNKNAHLIVNGDPDAQIDLDTPTVNVRLLPMNQLDSEVTVFLGDDVNGPEGEVFKLDPKNSLRYLFEQISFAKLTSSTTNSNVNYKTYGDLEKDTDNCTSESFNLEYAIGKFWNEDTLPQSGQPKYEDWLKELWRSIDPTEGDGPKQVFLDYTYDDASSHGPVGYFTITITKVDTNDGDHANGDVHTAKDVGPHVEEYTVQVTYKAYGLGEEDYYKENGNWRPAQNEHNMHKELIRSGNSDKNAQKQYRDAYYEPKTNKTIEPGPGIEVGTGGELKTGKGIVDSINHHWVSVIAGQISVTKTVTEAPREDKTFTFTLTRIADESEKEAADTTDTADTEEATEYFKSGTVTVKAGSKEGEGSITFSNLPRGKYLLTEVNAGEYHLDGIKVTDKKNCYQVEDADKGIYIYVGTDADGNDMITYYKVPVEGTCEHGEKDLFPVLQYSRWYNGGLSLGLNASNSTTPLMLRKVSMYNKDEGLSGAVFELYAEKDITSKGKVQANAEPIWVGTSGEDGYFTGNKIVDEDGNVVKDYGPFPSLAPGTYYLVETEAPGGFILLEGPVKLLITEEGAVNASLWNSPNVDFFEINKVKGTITISIRNYGSFDLPESGGEGVGRLYAVGGMMVLFVLTQSLWLFARSMRKKSRG